LLKPLLAASSLTLLLCTSTAARSAVGEAEFKKTLAQADYFKGTRQPLLALPLYRKAVKMRPNNSDVHAGLGWTLFELKLLQEGIEEELKAIELNPRNALAHHHLGVMYMCLNLLPQAADEFREEFAINPLRNCHCGPTEGLLMAFPPGYTTMIHELAIPYTPPKPTATSDKKSVSATPRTAKRLPPGKKKPSVVPVQKKAAPIH
jgi:tetratricopeptide (TPR) repeat protein